MCYQEFAVAESPEHADTGNAAGLGGGYVDVAIANIDRFLAADTQQSDGFENGVRGWLLVNACCLVLANGHVDEAAEEVVAERLGGCVELVAHHCRPTPSPLQFLQRLDNTVVRTGRVELVLHVMMSESGKGFVETGIGGAVGYGSFHEFPDAVAYHHAHLVHAVFGQMVGAHGVVHRCRKVAKGVEQCSVEVEDISRVGHGLWELPLRTDNHRAYLIIIAFSLHQLFDGQVHAVLPAVVGVAGHVDTLFSRLLTTQFAVHCQPIL